MAYTLDEFCADCRDAIKTDPGEAGHEVIRLNLEKLLRDEAFIAANFGASAVAGIRTVYRDPETDFNVLMHVCDKGKTGPPHDHGTSWGAYGQAVLHTDMKLWNRWRPGKSASIPAWRPRWRWATSITSSSPTAPSSCA